MYRNYAVWGGRSGGPVDEFFNSEGGDPQWERANLLGVE